MIVDETANLTAAISSEIEEAIDAIGVLNKFFGRETLSAALGEVSEVLVAAYIGAERVQRNARGDDLCKDGRLIEVKARFVANWGDALQFNFRSHTTTSHDAFCIAWVAEPGKRPAIIGAYRVTTPFLKENWGTPNQKKYCARTTLGKLRLAAATGLVKAVT